ncbi:MAG: DHH family phosphoesterase [Clostridia bacterium]|nr:DHH family phosphoesterase [Clostridia bacterium]
MNTIREIAEKLKKIKSAVIFTHVRPDGDTIGSGMALARALIILGKKCEVVNEGEVPEKFFFLEGMKDIKRAPSFDAEAFICVDTSDEARLGELQRTFTRAQGKGKLTINIDHHVSNTRFCKMNFVRERASNCENIEELIRALGVAPDRLIASYLLMGMVTDSGGFSHSDVTGDSFRAAAYCADAGADVNLITYEIFRKQSKARSKLYLETLSKLRFFLEDKLAICFVEKSALDQYGLKQDATEGIVDFALSIDCVEVSICLMEVKREQYKASFRSKGKVNVNEVARTFGGGGHVLASGCMLFGPLEEVYDKLQFTISQIGNL